MLHQAKVSDDEALIGDYLRECRELVIDEIQSFVPKDSRHSAGLYDLMLDYPLREAKALRPALCIATCRALGGALEGVLKSAAVLEFYHNAFLIHDDVEDASHKRRDGLTLHQAHGVPIAINVGDAMLALSLQPLLDNTRLLGLGKALRILQTIANMARESAEGQALELSWIRKGSWSIQERDYLRMVHKKTGHYTFITPVLIGCMVAGLDARAAELWCRFATALGLAFQIRDDVLNLDSSQDSYNKDLLGDLWEGKHTLVMLHAIASATQSERQRAIAVLNKPRPPQARALSLLEQTALSLAQDGIVHADAAAAILAAHASQSAGDFKTQQDIEFLFDLAQRRGSLEYAHQVALRRARRAQKTLCLVTDSLKPSVHLDFLRAVSSFVVERQT